MTTATTKNYKKLDKEYLQNLFKDFDFKLPPYQHQMQSWAFAMDGDRDRVAYFHDVGTGKTYTALGTALMWGCEKILVVCPNSAIKTWIEETNTFFPEWKVARIKGTKKQRKKKLKSDARVHIINYQGLQVAFGGWFLDQRTKKRSRVSDWNDIEEIAPLFDCIIFDESHNLRNYTLRTSISRYLSRNLPHTIIMTATPISKGEFDLWNQFLVLDEGQTLGTYYDFVRHFDEDIWGNMEIKKGHSEQVVDEIAPVTFRVDREECMDLPEASWEVRDVTPTKEIKEWQSLIKAGLKMELDKGQLTVNNVLTRFIKLQQVAGGFIKGDEGPVRAKKNPKLKVLEEVFDEIGHRKTIIFRNFNEEGRMIEELCDKKGIKWAKLDGTTKDKDAEIEKFRNDPECKVMIAHPQSGGVGLNLQCASVTVFYSSPPTPVLRHQAEGRTLRGGQDKNVVYIDLVMEQSTDELVRASLKDRTDISQMVLDWIADN